MTLMETAQLLGNFGEFVGAIAVVGTLVYLAVQVGQSRKSLDANTRSLEETRKLTRADMLHQLSSRFDTLRYRATEDREIASIFARGNEDIEGLDEVDREIYKSRVAAYFNVHYMFHQMAAAGFLDESLLDFVDRDMRVNWSTNGVRTLWNETFGTLYPYKDHVDALLGEGDRSG